MYTRNAIQICYGIPGIFCYFPVFYAMFGVRRILSRSFAFIYIMMAVSNVAAWLNAWIYLKLANEPYFYFFYEWLVGYPVVLKIQSFLVSHFNYVQNFDLLLLTIDRFVAILSIARNFQDWQRFYLLIAASSHIIAFAVHLTARFPILAEMYVNSDNEFVDGNSEVFVHELNANMQLGFGVFTFFSCTIINMMSLKLLRKYKKNGFSQTEMSFFMISFCTFLTQFLNVCIACMIAVFFPYRIMLATIKIIIEISFYASDLFSIGPAIYTILLPGPIRKFLMDKIESFIGHPSEDSQISSSS